MPVKILKNGSQINDISIEFKRLKLHLVSVECPDLVSQHEILIRITTSCFGGIFSYSKVLELTRSLTELVTEDDFWNMIQEFQI
jgi:hypothetical protein